MLMKGLGNVLTALIIGLSAHHAKTKIALQDISKDRLLMRLIHYSPRSIDTFQLKEYDQLDQVDEVLEKTTGINTRELLKRAKEGKDG